MRRQLIAYALLITSYFIYFGLIKFLINKIFIYEVILLLNHKLCLKAIMLQLRTHFVSNLLTFRCRRKVIIYTVRNNVSIYGWRPAADVAEGACKNTLPCVAMSYLRLSSGR